LMSKMEGNDKLEQLLSDVLANTGTARAMAAELGLAGEGPAAGGSAAAEAPKTEDE